MQDRLPPDRRKPLATRGRTIHWVNRAISSVGRLLPVYPDKQIFSESVGMSQRQRTHVPQQLPAYSITSSARCVIVFRVRSQQMTQVPLTNRTTLSRHSPGRTGGVG